MNYYERYMGDYMRDTTHLTLSQHGAYSVLLDVYYSTSQPLPSQHLQLYKLCRAISREERAAVRFIADAYFPVCEDGMRHNSRADNEINKAHKRIEAARNNGKKGGAAKHKPVQSDPND